MTTTYSLGCTDCNGCALDDTIPVGPRKERIFKPDQDPRYANSLDLPALLTKYNPELQITHLHVSPDLPAHIHDGLKCAEQDIIVMEVAAKIKGPMILDARVFGAKSEYNRHGIPHNASIDVGVARTTCIGCQTIMKIVNKHPQIKKAYIMTSSEAIVDGMTNVFDWFEKGFPTTFSEGLSKQDFLFLHTNIKALEDKGVDVRFWKVDPEYITGAMYEADCALLDVLRVPTDAAPECLCVDCVNLAQYKEKQFATTGMCCCPCPKFTLTNNADVTIPNCTMQVDAKGMSFIDSTCNPSGDTSEKACGHEMPSSGGA